MFHHHHSGQVPGLTCCMRIVSCMASGPSSDGCNSVYRIMLGPGLTTTAHLTFFIQEETPELLTQRNAYHTSDHYYHQLHYHYRFTPFVQYSKILLWLAAGAALFSGRHLVLSPCRLPSDLRVPGHCESSACRPCAWRGWRDDEAETGSGAKSQSHRQSAQPVHPQGHAACAYPPSTSSCCQGERQVQLLPVVMFKIQMPAASNVHGPACRSAQPDMPCCFFVLPGMAAPLGKVVCSQCLPGLVMSWIAQPGLKTQR